ncbi:hypothetical protein L1987_78560 [Smallanthus sonchifolius]|uniref:Uncharacterized protein n=1 Tax=Smallanthus sonchifolius TaxID=185202 RepID=A0ACB8ZD74_9ASTR|nr:hypothetical protein L1987_78560 [Smallanthus sonchifolius]
MENATVTSSQTLIFTISKFCPLHPINFASWLVTIQIHHSLSMHDVFNQALGFYINGDVAGSDQRGKASHNVVGGLYLRRCLLLNPKVEFHWKIRKPRPSYLSHLAKKQLSVNDSRLTTLPPPPKWKKKIDSPVVEAAMDDFVNKLLQEFVVDLDVVDLVGDHLELFRKNQAAIGREVMVTLSSEERDERLKHHLMASKELHPALISSENEPWNPPSSAWARVLEAATQRRTEVLHPENLENMWTRGRNYKKKTHKKVECSGINENFNDQTREHNLDEVLCDQSKTSDPSDLIEENNSNVLGSKSNLESSNSVSDLNIQNQVGGLIISEFYSANAGGDNDVDDIHSGSDKVTWTEGYVLKLRCRDLLSITNIVEQHEVWDFLSMSSKSYSFGRSSSVVQSLAVNVDDAVVDIARQFKGVSGSLMKKVVGPCSPSESESSVANRNVPLKTDSVTKQTTSDLGNSFSDNEECEKDRLLHHEEKVGPATQANNQILEKSEEQNKNSSEVQSEIPSLAANLPSTSGLKEDPLGVPAEWSPPNSAVCLKQLGYGLLELTLLTVFPELQSIMLNVHEKKKEQLTSNFKVYNSQRKNKEMVEKLEICINILKMGFEFVMVFFGDLKFAIHQSNQQSMSCTSQTPYIGLLP